MPIEYTVNQPMTADELAQVFVGYDRLLQVARNSFFNP